MENKNNEETNKNKKAHMKYRLMFFLFFLQHVHYRRCLAFYTWGDKMKESTLNAV